MNNIAPIRAREAFAWRRPSLEVMLTNAPRPIAGRSLFIVDPNPAFAHAIHESIQDRTPEVDIGSFETGSALLDRLAAVIPRAIAINLFLPDVDVMHLIQCLRRRGPTSSITIVGLLDFYSKSVEELAQGAGADRVITKPCSADELLLYCRLAEFEPS